MYIFRNRKRDFGKLDDKRGDHFLQMERPYFVSRQVRKNVNCLFSCLQNYTFLREKPLIAGKYLLLTLVRSTFLLVTRIEVKNNKQVKLDLDLSNRSATRVMEPPLRMMAHKTEDVSAEV